MLEYVYHRDDLLFFTMADAKEGRGGLGGMFGKKGSGVPKQPGLPQQPIPKEIKTPPVNEAEQSPDQKPPSEKKAEIPTLKIEQISRSDKPLIGSRLWKEVRYPAKAGEEAKVEKVPDRDKFSILFTGDTTIGYVKGNDDFFAEDGKGNEQGLLWYKLKRTAIIDWYNDLQLSRRVNQIVSDSDKAKLASFTFVKDEVVMVGDITDKRYAKFIESRIEMWKAESGHQQDIFYNISFSSNNQDLKGSETQLKIVGDYVVALKLYSTSSNTQKKSDLWIAWKTKDKLGHDLPADQWERLDTVDEYNGIVPDNLLQEIKFMQKGWSDLTIKKINDKLEAMGTDTGKHFSINLLNENGERISSLMDDWGEPFTHVFVDRDEDYSVYYLSKNDPNNINKTFSLDDGRNWHKKEIKLPSIYGKIYTMEFDFTGSYCLLDTDKGTVVLKKGDFSQVETYPNLMMSHFNDRGYIRGIDKNDGHLVTYKTNIKDISDELERRRTDAERKKREEAIKQISVKDLLEEKREETAEDVSEDLKHLIPDKQRISEQFTEILKLATGFDDIDKASTALVKLEHELRKKGFSEEEIKFITQDIGTVFDIKRREIAKPQAESISSDIASSLDAGFSIEDIQDAQDRLSRLKSLEPLLDKDGRRKAGQLESRLEKEISRIYTTEGEQITKSVTGLVDGALKQIRGITNLHEFNDWQEVDLQAINTRLITLAAKAPLQAHEIHEKILEVRRRLQEGTRQRKSEFEKESAQIREKATDITKGKIDVIREDIGSLIGRLREKGYKKREDAQLYIDGDKSLEAIRLDIESLQLVNPDAARELLKDLKVSISNELYNVGQKGKIEIAKTGQFMIHFGKESFPRWEGHVVKKEQKQADLVFVRDERTVGPGMKPDDVFGDISIKFFNSQGDIETVRLFEGEVKEGDWRFGLNKKFDIDMSPAYITQKAYRELKNQYSDWTKGEEKSKIRIELKEKREALSNWHKTRKRRSERGDEDLSWQEKYKELLDDYAKFYSKNNISLLKRIDEVKNSDLTIEANGRGFVPKWENYWVVDRHTEQYLEQLAEFANMQLELKEGAIVLKGHAGVGKDTIAQIFASEQKTNRPYFEIDVTKWTTEFELSEDVQLGSKEGASFTKYVESVVLKAIRTPGAILYINEFNAMPEQAQIFLHSLFDFKRGMTLKVEGGKTVKADPSVLIIASMNPNYPGTFEPQYATRSRMVSIQVDYPPLTRKKDENDPNQNDPYDVSEALRIARGVNSLSDLTIEQDLEINGFVKMWDKYINGIDNGGQVPSAIQEFDLETILALVQFSDKLRRNFILRFEKSRERNVLPVTQPLTSRELRQAAYGLNKIPDGEKATGDPEKTAKELLEKFFLSHIDDSEDREKIKNAMKTWTFSLRPGVARKQKSTGSAS